MDNFVEQTEPPFRFYLRAWPNGQQIVLWTHRENEVRPPNELPDYDTRSMVVDYEPNQVQQVLWAKDHQPHLPFMPIDFDFEQPIFQRFNYTFDQLPIVRHGGWHSLDSAVADSWRRMEVGLGYVGSTLLTGFLFPLDIWQQYPINHGYYRRHTSERAARGCAWRSLQCFHELIAFCRQAVAMQTSDWEEWLAKRNKGRDFHPGWLTELRQSITSYESYGAIVDPSRCQWSKYLDRYKGNCPLWYLGAQIDVSGRVEFITASNMPRNWQQPAITDIQQFIDEINLVDTWVQCQPIEDSDLCIRPYCYACQGSPPLAPTILRLDSPGIDDYLQAIRTPLFLPDGDDIIESEPHYPDSGEPVLYRPFSPYEAEAKLNQSGLVVSNPPIALSSIPLKPMERVCPVTPVIIPPMVVSNSLVPSLVTDDMKHAALDVDLIAVYGLNIVCSRIYTPDMHQALRERHGYLDSQQELFSPVADVPFDLAIKILSHTGHTADIPSTQQSAICTFVSCTLNGTNIPPSLWDLNTAHAQYLNRNHSVLPYQIDRVDLLHPGQPSKAVKLYTLSTSVSLDPFDMCNQPLIATDNAVTVVHCLRVASHWDERALIRHLLTWGCRFFRSHPYAGSDTNRPARQKGLGSRPNEYQPLPADYAQYEHARNYFLTSSRARAAFKHGGLIWRLAREKYRDIELAVDAVFSAEGPPQTGSSLHLVRLDSVKRFDDCLSEEEEELICGVYKVYTEDGHSFAEVSWWPQPSAWATSGLNVGYWSSDAEDWFQTRLEAIRTGTAKLYNATYWKKGMKMRKTALKFSREHERLAAQFLDP